MSLLEKQAKLLAEHQAMEKYDPHWKAEAEAGRKISERPVAFLCDDEVVIVGDDVAKIRDALAKFIELTETESWHKRAAREQVAAYAESKVKAILSRPAGDELRMHQQHWNAVALAMGEIGQEVVLSDGAD